MPAVLVAIVAVARLAGPDAFHAVVTEDGPLEWLQVAAYVAAAAWFAAAARSNRQLFPALAAAGFVLVAGEEMAWGQRLFDLRVGVVQDVNRQGELTLHNIGNGLELSWLAFALLAFGGWVGHRIARVAPRTAPVAPDPGLRWYFAPAAAYAASRLLVDDPTYAFAKLGESFEACVAIGFAITARGRRRAPASDGSHRLRRTGEVSTLMSVETASRAEERERSWPSASAAGAGRPTTPGG